jgi:hypothetical protein
MDTLQSSIADEEIGPPDYIYDLIKISLLAAACDVESLISAVETARDRGADNREILRAMFRSDEAFGTGIESVEFLRLAESLQAGRSPLPVQAEPVSA